MAQLQPLIDANDYESLAVTLESTELEARTAKRNSIPVLLFSPRVLFLSTTIPYLFLLLHSQMADGSYATWPVAIHLMTLMILGRLEEARLVWRRIPPGAKGAEHADAHAVWSALQGLWNRDFPTFWRQITGHAWTGQAGTVAVALQNRIRQR